ncbi:hypothetical protein [Streptomyces sp. SAJ15]|uniref:hypothetical protein n=1 Tax=Streptomyces sp. SAJ15 TaxID=2011095 RepID=UPI0011868AEA|nr:hypothetical protein [Streptomyces sp. SAJ15]TVL87997.1 hypothetical protein CD790_32080 [Streptomyces sp. SAJ15]
MMIRQRLVVAVAFLVCLGAVPMAAHAYPPAAMDHGWQSVGEQGATHGISGVAVVGHDREATEALLVRDNRQPGEGRVATVRLRPGADPEVRELHWKGTPPGDLEALDAVPGRPHHYIALAGGGTGYHLRVVRDTLAVLGSFTVPGVERGDDYQGFALFPHGERLVAVWADRGDDTRPATVRAATFDPGRLALGTPTAVAWRVPLPAADVRHASDLKVSPSGALMVVSTSGPGEEGPFDSVVHDAGRLSVDGAGTVSLTMRTAPVELGRFPGHKVEALGCLPRTGEASQAGQLGQALLGADDERAGGALRFAGVCLQ